MPQRSITSRIIRSRILATIQMGLLAMVLAGTVAGCAGRREAGYSDRDGATAATRSNNAPTNYGTSNSSLDRQAEDNKLDLMKYKTSF